MFLGKMIVPKLLRISPKLQNISKGSLQPHMAGLPYNPNSFFGNGTVPTQPVIIVRAEEALIVILVLALWVGAIALFFNRWGKIRMLEPYQPKFIQQHRPSCPLVDQVQHRSFSKFNISGDVFLNHQKIIRPRQNSVFVGSSLMTLPLNAPRKVKSAFDLQNLVLSDPALNRSGLKVNVGAEYFRRPSLLPVYARKVDSEHTGERRLSFKDLVDIERSLRCERVQCYLEKEPTDTEITRKNRKLGETKQRSTISTQSSQSDSRHNSITNQDLKPSVSGCSKLSGHERRSSLMPASPNLKDSDNNELRPEPKSGVNNFRRNSMLLINSLESDRNFLNPRENIRSGVQDFRRNSMLIINNLTEDIGYRSTGRNFSLGGSNVALAPDFIFTGRRNSVIPPYEGRHKLSVPHVSIPKTKAGKFHTIETKYMSQHKPSKSLDCGDSGKMPNWKTKIEASHPTLSEAKKQFLMPIVPLNFVGSSASLNTEYSHKELKIMDESRSTGNLNSDKLDFIHPRIIETRCYSPNTEDSGCKSSSDEVQSPKNTTANEEKEKKEVLEEKESGDDSNKSTVTLTTSLTNLNIKSSGPVNVVTSSEAAKKPTNAAHLSHV